MMTTRHLFPLPLLLLLLALVFPGAWADEKPLTYDRISLSVTASAQVENNILVAMLYAQREGSQAAKLVDEVNRVVRWGLDLAREAADVKVQTLDYNTRPIYRNQTLTGWRARQSIRLESGDAEQLSKLIGKLQERLSVQSVGYDVSPQLRQGTEDRLIAEAIDAFKNRAGLVTKRMGRSEYRLVRMDVNTVGVPVRPVPMRAMAMEASAAPPALEAGTQTVRVTVSGTIELQL